MTNRAKLTLLLILSSLDDVAFAVYALWKWLK